MKKKLKKMQPGGPSKQAKKSLNVGLGTLIGGTLAGIGNLIAKSKESRIDRLYDKKKKATVKGDMKKKQRIENRIASVRGRSLSEGEMDLEYKKGGSVKKGYHKMPNGKLMKGKTHKKK